MLAVLRVSQMQRSIEKLLREVEGGETKCRALKTLSLAFKAQDRDKALTNKSEF